MNSQKILRNLVLCLLAFTMFVAAYTVLKTMTPSPRALENRPYFVVDIEEIPLGEAREFEWRGEPFLIFRRNAEQIASLDQLRSASRTPDAPETISGLHKIWRSQHAEIFVAKLKVNHSVCGAHFRAKENAPEWATPWYGGFVEPCKGAAYDPAGRVYKSGIKKRKIWSRFPTNAQAQSYGSTKFNS